MEIYTERKTCRSCSSTNFKDVLSLGKHYLSEFRDDNQKPPKYPLDLVLCSDCKLLQLKHTTPQSELYTENYGYKSGISNTIKANLQEIVEEAVSLIDFEEGDIWLDAGSNDGTLLTFVPENVIKVACEPIKKLAKESEKVADIVINDFWSYENYEKAVTDEKLSNLRKRNSKKILSQSKKLGKS